MQLTKQEVIVLGKVLSQITITAVTPDGPELLRVIRSILQKLEEEIKSHEHTN
jgi:hypothetical protein